jgi:hypothetical protein
MADRTSAGLFGKIFNLLAKNPTDEHKKIAAEIWPETHEYDFNPYQMNCDDALVALDLARNGIDPRCPEDGVTILYGPKEG